MPEGSDRCPDVAGIPIAKWEALTAEERRGFLPLYPDFVIELLSPSDSWSQGQKKIEEYRANGCRLGWLLDPKRQRAGIYRPGKEVEILQAPDTLFGEDVLLGLAIDVRFLWQ